MQPSRTASFNKLCTVYSLGLICYYDYYCDPELTENCNEQLLMKQHVW